MIQLSSYVQTALHSKSDHLAAQGEEGAGNQGALRDSCAKYCDGCWEAAGTQKPLGHEP